MGESSNEKMFNALYSATYVDNFLDTIENLPDEVQREISSIRELDVQYQALLLEMENMQSHYQEETDSLATRKLMIQIQSKLIMLQELGDEKLQIVQRISDIIENRQRQLDLDCKNLGKCTDLEQEDRSDSTKDSLPERSSKRSRRTRTEPNHTYNDSSNDVPVTPCTEKQGALRNATNRGSSQKKSAKKKKRKSRGGGGGSSGDREREDSPTEIPIDPNEPTYCLCEQVSYGEMIGCDNDLCPIEWFHFSCVNLTNKPKGKWFCPKCRGDKPTVMKPRAQFLKELQKYNKEKEERL